MVCCMCCGDVCFKKPLLQQHSGGHMGALGSLGSLGSLGPRRLPVGWPSGCAYAWYSPLLAAAAPGLKRYHRHPGTSAALSKSTCFWWECQWRSWKRMGLGWGYAHFFSSLLSTLIIIYVCKLCMKHVLFPSTNEECHTSNNISPTFHSSCWYVAFTFHLLSVWLKSIPLGAFQTIQYNHPLISNYTWNHDSTLFIISQVSSPSTILRTYI